MAEKPDSKGTSEPSDGEDLGGEHTLPGGAVCGACGAVAADRFCGACGFEVQAPASDEEGPPWPRMGERLDDGDRPLDLAARLRSHWPSSAARRFLGVDDEGRRHEVLVVRRGSTDVLAARAEARALLGEAALAPSWTFDRDDLRFTITAYPPGARSLRDWLEAVLADRAGPDPLDLVAGRLVPVARALAALHEGGHFVGNLDPREVLVDEGGGCAFREPACAHPLTAAPLAPGRRRVVPGFAAPEVYGHCGGGVGPATDVFFLGVSLYYLLARIEPLVEAADPQSRLPPPRVYFADVPPELAAVAMRAVSPIPARRYATAPAFLGALEQALETARRRRAASRARLSLDIGHELHIGILKGQFSPQNQDDLFLAFDGRTAIGLFVICDGVSISEYGSGDLASACVRAEAAATWESLCRGADGRPELPADEGERRALVRRLLDGANARIAELIHEQIPRFPGPPEGIMASTAVVALLDGDRCTLASIGDSRSYLIRDGHIATLMVDDNFETQLLRMGRSPSAARSVPSGGALVRCVGEFDKGPDDRLVPVPLEPEFRELRLLPGDQLVLCSDGIPDYAGLDEEDAEDRMRRVVEEAPGAPWAAFELMVLANRGGGGDNISCIVLRFGPPIEAEADTEVGGGTEAEA